jgi:stage II sporulation protein R
MRKYVHRIVICFLVAVFVWTAMLIADRQALRTQLIRLHVVAASDSAEDQEIKLRVRDAVLGSLRQGLSDLTDMEQAVAYVEEMIPKIENAANLVLAEAGFADTVQVSLTEWEFPEREYDTFSLPAGVYNALRVVIGEGEGQNWWCVVFPELCMGVTTEEFREMSSFSDGLNDTLTGEYEIRFWLLDKLGELENFLHRTSDGE